MGPFPWAPTNSGGSVGGQKISGSSYDPAAASFFAAQALAGQTLTTTQKSAVNSRVISAKAGTAYWFKLLSYYPFLGNSATCDSFNLVSPATFQIIWSGTVTHNANGITGDGVTSFGDTGLNANTIGQDSCSWGVYARVLTAASVYCEIGFNTGNEILNFLGGYFFDNDFGFNGARVSGSLTPGVAALSRNVPGALNAYINGSNIGTSSTVSDAHASSNFAILAADTSASRTSADNLASAFIASGMTDADMAQFYTDEQAFQTALSRQV